MRPRYSLLTPFFDVLSMLIWCFFDLLKTRKVRHKVFHILLGGNKLVEIGFVIKVTLGIKKLKSG